MKNILKNKHTSVVGVLCALFISPVVLAGCSPLETLHKIDDPFGSVKADSTEQKTEEQTQENAQDGTAENTAENAQTESVSSTSELPGVSEKTAITFVANANGLTDFYNDGYSDAHLKRKEMSISILSALVSERVRVIVGADPSAILSDEEYDTVARQYGMYDDSNADSYVMDRDLPGLSQCVKNIVNG